MTRRLREVLLASLLVLTARGRVAAQQPATDLLAQGMRAYQSLDYDQAAALLRRGLTRTEGDTLSTAERLQALTYLGATELFRDRRDAALAAFRQIAVTDPRYRPNEMIFPPQVTGVFGEVRKQTKTVFLQVPPETEFRAKTEHFTARLVASSPHEIAVTITTGDGKPVRRLYDGPIVDSLAVTWDGLTEERNPVQSGRYLLRVAPRTASAGQLVRQLSLEVLRARPDTQPWPAGGGVGVGDRTSLPLHSSSGPAIRSLAGGLVAAAAVVVLPSLVSHDAAGFKGRFAVAAAIGGAGIVSFFAQRSAPPPAVDAIAGANTVARDAARRRLEQVQKQNAQSVSEVRLIVRAGPATLVELGGGGGGP
jgi:hypothetical protein